MERGKGAQKDYDRWMEDQLEDYSLPAHPELNLSKITQEVSQATNVTTLQVSPQKLKAVPVIKKIYKVDFDVLETWSRLKNKALMTIADYLGSQDILRLRETCKALYSILDRGGVWKVLYDRINPNSAIKNNNVVDMKYLYKFSLYSKRIGTLYHTRQPVEKDEGLQLVTTIVDFIPVKKVELQQILEKGGLQDFSCDNLKLSWIPERNKVCLWLSSFEINHSRPLKPNPKVLKIFSFEEDELVKKAFFLSEQFLVVELQKKSGLSRSQHNNQVIQEETKTVEVQDQIYAHKHLSTFLIYNLETELRCTIFGEDPQPHTRCKFYINNEENQNKISKKTHTTHNFTYNVNIPQKEKDALAFDVKAINDEEIAFITTDTQQPAIILFNLKTHEFYLKSFELESMMKSVICSAKGKQDLLVFFLADIHQNIFKLSLFKSSQSQVEKICIESKEKEENETKPEAKQERYAEYTKHYQQGRYHEQKTNSVTEYLTIYQEQIFYFIDILKGKVHRFSPSEPFRNWTIYKNKLCLLSDKGVLFYDFSFIDDNFEINSRRQAIFAEETKNCPYQWILMNNCFTVILASTTRFSRASKSLYVKFGSTQTLIYGATFPLKWNCREINLMGFQEEKIENWELDHIIKPEKLVVKFEKEKLLIKGGKHRIFFDFGVTKQNYQRISIALAKIDFEESFVANSSLTENDADNRKYKIHLANYDPVKENKNKTERKIEHVDNWKIEGEDVEKEKNQKKRNQDKGKKYYKNDRQDNRLEKLES